VACPINDGSSLSAQVTDRSIGRAQVIVTCDTGDFPAEKLAPYDIEAQHPDTFITYQKEENTVAVLNHLKEARLTYNSPPLSVQEFIARFRSNEMPLTAAWLETARFLLE
jgi:hypothetical protein